MDLAKYLTVLVVFFIDDGETGGHGGKHHDHVKVHIPEFIHHDHHTKVITIHHHHHKPKKEHHHHHHHHHKTHVVPHHHYHKKTETKHTETKKHHGHHGHHGHHHGHHKHHGHHGHHKHHGHHGHHKHHGHEHHGHHHHDAPSFSYEPTGGSFEDDFPSYSPPVPSYDVGYNVIPHSLHIPQVPQVRGIQHTVKQVKVFDSLPGAIPNAGGTYGYEVTEQNADEDDEFTSINSVQQAYPATQGFLSGAAPQASHDPFGETPTQAAVQSHDPFAAAPQPTAEAYGGTYSSESFPPSAPTQSVHSGIQPSPEIPISFQSDGGFDNLGNSFAAGDGNTVLFANDGRAEEEGPVSFSREAGIQQVVKTGGSETVVY